MTTTRSVAPSTLAGFGGTLLRPGDEGYEQGRRIWNGAVDRRPAFLAQCTSTTDVAAAVRFAVTHGLPLAVRGGGHSIPGFSTVEGGLVVDLSPMRRVQVDPVARTAEVQPGVLLGELDAATCAHGLAVPAGEVSHTGVAGLALGGGMGWLSREHGLTCDNLLAAEVVAADGTVHEVDARTDPEWLWGLRGGGGNFGVVTRFTFRLHPLGPVSLATAVWPGGDAARPGLRLYRDLAERLPRAAGLVAALVTAPPAPPFPEALQGRPVCVLTAAAWGEDAADVLAPVRRSGAPAVVADTVPYPVLQSMVDATTPHGLHYYVRSEVLDRLPDDVLEGLARTAASATSPMGQVLLRALGGAVGDVDPAATAFAHRSAQHLLTVAGCWTPEDEPEPHRAWCRQTWALARGCSCGTYVNQLDRDERDRVREAYPPDTLERLRTLKRRVDPGNVFRLNQNIVP